MGHMNNENEMSRDRFITLCKYGLGVLSWQFVPKPVRNIFTEEFDSGSAAAMQELPKSPEAGEDIQIITGDVMLGRSVGAKSIAWGDPAYPFRKVAGVLSDADLVFINMENPVFEGCPTNTDPGSFTFCADPKMLEGLILGGVDVVNLANNHARNFGPQGLEETEKLLNENNIRYVGTEGLLKQNIDATGFGFLGFDFTYKKPGPDQVAEIAGSVEAAKKQTDILIISVHWGDEYQPHPSDYQKKMAELFALSGADIVVGHHPHWVQDWEILRVKRWNSSGEASGVPVYYSLGNFIFDQMWSEKTRTGLVLRLTVRNKKIIRTERMTTHMDSFAQPEFINDSNKITSPR
jgi:poly-gamma-glutamate synthesis protein (capsule biosynthesis protein)